MIAGEANVERLRLEIRGAVQGVGFRPFVYRLATSLRLSGWVNNSTQGITLEAEGPRLQLEEFLRRLPQECPPLSLIQTCEHTWLAATGARGFEITASEAAGRKSALVLPDIATCAECWREILDPANRRYRYPFTNCTHCGPRFSIIERLPYDRLHTTMKGFVMCQACRDEYDEPADRRFHAQPNACPVCGPQVEWWGAAGEVLAEREEALGQCVEAIRDGAIVAVKGLGGFHLMVDAGNEASVQRLRQVKHREEKPLALMFPDMDQVRAACAVSELEERWLRSPQAPIMLLRRHASAVRAVADSVAPANPFLGVMLPYTPLHHLLLGALQRPIVATSGNLSDEPICTDEREAVRRLAGLADRFLVHNRPIARHVDDSIVRAVAGRELVLRRARGFAPLPVMLRPSPPPVLAVGAHLKNTIAVSVGPQVFLSQHIGDLETEEALAAFRRVIVDFKSFYEVHPVAVVADAHPDYLSSQYARHSGLAVQTVQHHYAHVLACLAEHGLEPEALGVSWDGTGLGTDGTIWGGEFLWLKRGSFERFAHLRTFRLPGGETAVQEPRRVALGLLFEVMGESLFERRDVPVVTAFSAAELRTLRQMLTRGLNAPLTSSMGRLFDGVAALVGLRQRVAFEGQAAMELEWAMGAEPASPAQPGNAYALEVISSGDPRPLVLDWAPLISALLADVAAGVAVARMALKFHNALATAIVEVARRAGQKRVVLTGGCFQNLYLAEQSILRLRETGFEPVWHRLVPPNDGGIALGQAMAANRMS